MPVPATNPRETCHCRNAAYAKGLHARCTLAADLEAVPKLQSPYVWVPLAVLALASAILVWQRLRPDTSGGERTATGASGLTVPLPPATTVSPGRGPSIALSADGRRLAYVGESHGVVRLFLSELGRRESAALDGTEGASEPFFSPDARWLGFFADDKLKKISVDGGAAETLADAPAPRGVAWISDDSILLAPRDNGGLWRVPARGGVAEPFTTLGVGEVSHRWPQLLPGGKGVLYTIWSGGEFDRAMLAVQPSDGSEGRVIRKRGGFGRFVGDDSGGRNFLVYMSAEGLEAVRFDLATLAATGDAVALPERVITNRSGGVQAAVSPDGSLAFVPEAGNPVERELKWVNRHGVPSPAATLRSMSVSYGLSNDGTRIVRFKTESQQRDVWIEDLVTRTSARLGFHGDPTASAALPPTEGVTAVFSPDDTHVVYAAGRPVTNLFLVPAGGGPSERLTTSPHRQWPTSWSRDGRTIAFVESNAGSGADIWILTLDEARKPLQIRPLVRTEFGESSGGISPDGRWLAYHSNESGRYEVYVQPLPDGGRRWQVSTESGVYPRWSPRGNELFFRSGPTRAGFSSASVRARPEFEASVPRELFDARPYETPFEVSPEAARFLMIQQPTAEPATEITVIVNWLGELRQLVR